MRIDNKLVVEDPKPPPPKPNNFGLKPIGPLEPYMVMSVLNAAEVEYRAALYEAQDMEIDALDLQLQASELKKSSALRHNQFINDIQTRCTHSKLRTYHLGAGTISHHTCEWCGKSMTQTKVND